jgi:5'(3')-deoxyribonucleotidase
MNKVIAFDMDDVLVELLDTWLNVLNRHHGLHVKREDIVEWDMKKAFPTLTDFQLYGVLSYPYLWKEVQVKDNGPATIEKLLSEGYEVIVVTASSPSTISTKLRECLFKYYPMLTYHDVIVCHKKQLVKCDYIVDDAPHNLEGHDAIKFLMDAPYNQDCPEDLYDFRVKNIEEVYDIIKQIENIS